MEKEKNQNENYKKELQKSLEILKKKKILLYPTDTIWGLGCDAFCKEALYKIYQIKKRDFSKPMILLVESLKRLESLVHVPTQAKEMIETYSRPLTIIYENLKKKATSLFENTSSLAIRLTKNPFCVDLIKGLDRPIISTSANFSNARAPFCFDEIDLLLLQKVDYVVKFSREKKSSSASTILKISLDNKLQIIRK